MAAPASKTIGDQNGKWVMNKTLSDSVEPGLSIQGIGYLTRKAINFATVTLHIKQYADEAGTVHIDIDQTATGGIKGTSEKRCLDGEKRGHSDWLFGKVEGRTVWAGPAADLATNDWVKDHGVDFLTHGWLEGDAEATAPGGKSHLISYVESVDNGWTAIQVWGFQTIGGERRYARNIVIKKGDKKAETRLVYDYVPQ